MAQIISYCSKHKIFGRCELCENEAKNLEPPRWLKRKKKDGDDDMLHELDDEIK